MKKNKISITDYGHNFWTGCPKISSGCKNCYMHRLEDRFGKDANAVVKSSDKYFNYPTLVKKPLRIFACDMSDFFIEQADAWRADAWRVIKETPWHTWQILTKRPERIAQCLPKDWGENGYPNVWLGVSVEDNASFHRIETLSKIPAALRFASIEPMLEDIDLLIINKDGQRPIDSFQWIIFGGESGNKMGKYRFRPSSVKWFLRAIDDLKTKTRAAVFVKQLGTFLARELSLKDRHGANIDEFPEQLRVREIPRINNADTV